MAELRARLTELRVGSPARTWHVTAGSAALGLAVALAAVAVAGPWESGQRTAERAVAAVRDGRTPQPASAAPHRATSPAAAAPDVLTALDEGGGSGGSPDIPLPTAQGLGDTLAPLLAGGGLGPVRTAAVVDVATGRTLYGKGAGTPTIPASTAKIGTAVAALSLLGADHRFTTGVVAAGGDRIVLVGGGDPTLTARARAGGGYDAASMRTLADDTARALRLRGTKRITLAYDTSLYTGPARHPIGVNDNVALVTALMVDEGRLDGSSFKGPVARADDPAASAAVTFADLLRARGITVSGKPSPGRAPRTTPRWPNLASVQSPPLSALVERMLTNSDNDIAEALLRQVAIAAGQPASFTGGARAVATALRRLGLPSAGARFTDGSGLSQADRLTAGQLAGLLVLAADPDHPELRPVLTGLAVAGFTGSLSGRFGTDVHRAGAGFVRAKTGTLTGVNSLAGTVVDADGRMLAFAFLTRDTKDAVAAQEALDRLAAAVSECGCR
jgi:D-alanyl-D-alanine carboxypeptidase/D-alanyl-D-alanine-endopeptidase (penicillin-binding protein 4)